MADKVTPLRPAKKVAKKPPRSAAHPAGRKLPEVDVFDPAVAAHEMRLQGQPWRVVAPACGYNSEQAAIMAVSRLLTEAAAEVSKTQRAERLALQLERYEQVLSTNWKMMKAGDDKATGHVLNTLGRIDKLFKLDQPDPSEQTGARTIVIAGSPEEYAARLRELVEGGDQSEG